MPSSNRENVEHVLIELRSRIEGVLTGNLVGLYLYGSLVHGAFEPGVSDIDLLAVIKHDLDELEFLSVESMHHAFAAAHPDWDDRIEVQYLPAAALNSFKTITSKMAAISPGEPFHGKFAGHDWLLNWYDVQQHGRTLVGPPPGDHIPHISHEEFVSALREQALEWADRVAQLPPRPGAQAYAILTMCRALYGATYGAQASKTQAARWAQRELPPWAPLIARALEWRLNSHATTQEDGAPVLPTTVEFVRLVSARVLET